jgi:hypothetical protein
MAVLNVTENPSTTDDVIFDLTTLDANGCLTDPYKVDRLVIYYVERDFSSNNLSEYKEDFYITEKMKAAMEAEALACADPSQENIEAAQRARLDAEASKTTTPFYFNDSKPVHVVGNKEFPAWLSSDEENSFLEHVTEDEDANPLVGNFKYTWQPVGMREGDYFICWTWTPLPAGESYSQHFKFYLKGATEITTTIPTHQTPPEKYETLLERYTPEVFKMLLCDGDRTPDVIDKLNKSVADGFTVLENLANQIIDLYDANALDESLLPYLSNTLGLKLKSYDPTRWRKQIKRAVPLYKRKGTRGGVVEGLDQAGIKLVKYTSLWQVISAYTWQEIFKYDGETSWTLAKVALPVDLDNFQLSIRAEGEEDYTEISSDYVSFSTVDGVTTMTWEGSSLSTNPLDLMEGDIIKVLYKYNEIPSPAIQTIEDYVRALPLADQRDETDQDYPLKNMNVRLIAEDDPLFDVIIPQKHPYHDDIIFGKVRTEFPYSENIYNMDEYNGSIRNSKDPCDIDKDFLDPCFACISSKYNADLEIEELTNDRIYEAVQILTEHMPFHAVLQNLNIYGGFHEFMEQPEEVIEGFIRYSAYDDVIAGSAQMWFNRAMKRGTTTATVLRNQLATATAVASGTGIAFNDKIVIFCGDINFENLGMATDGRAVLEILSSSLAGKYRIDNPDKNTAQVSQGSISGVNDSSISEPITETNSSFENQVLSDRAFTFRISNPVEFDTPFGTVFVYQDNIQEVTDANLDYQILNIKTQWDVAQGTASAPWQMSIPAYSGTPYDIKDILPNGVIVLDDPAHTLPTSNATGVIYTLLDEIGNVKGSSTTGFLRITARGRTVASGTGIQDIFNLQEIEYYQLISGNQYKVTGLVAGTDDEFYISGYTGGDVGPITLTVWQRVTENQVGYLSHNGLRLDTSPTNHETGLPVSNGGNSVVPTPLEDNTFKQNYLIDIDGDIYFMADIDGSLITLEGPDKYWKTWQGGGTSVSYDIYQYEKTENVTIPGQQFDLPAYTFRIIDRRGGEIITNTTDAPPAMPMMALSAGAGDDNVINYVQQGEGISFNIEYLNGSTEQGEI